MNFQVLSDEELKAQQGIIEAGECDFEIILAEETTAKSSGAPMLKLQLNVWDKNGRKGTVYENITASTEWKIKSLCEAIGRIDFWKRGSIQQGDLLGQSGKAMILIQKDPQYGDWPKVKYFISQNAEKVPAKQLPDFNDKGDSDIPF